MAKGDVLKSVRVREVNASIDARSNGFGDIEVRVIDEGGKKITVGWIHHGPNQFNSYGMDFKTTGKYSLYTPDNFIHLMMWIESSKKRNENPYGDVLESQEDFTQDYYKIIQDPYDKDNVPRSRSFSGDPYYLNNKTKVSIFWIRGSLSAGGTTWSDEDGGELPQPQEAYFYSENENVGTWRDKSSFSKYVFISNEESGEKFTLNENLTDFLTDVKSPNDIHTWASPIQAESVLDETILNKIVEIWKTKVVDYDDLGVCYNKIKKPSPFSCNEVVYKSPIGGFVPDEEKPTPTEESVQTQGTPTIKLSVVLPEDLELKVKQDLNGLMVYIGDPPPEEGAFVFQDDFDNLEELDDEYMESGFAGDEELIMKEPDEEFRQEIEKAGDDAENNPVSGDTLPNSWFNYSTKKFGQPDVNKTYSSEYRSYIDPSKMPKPKMTKESLIAVKLKVEGGLTGNPNDSAAKKGFCPTPLSGKKYHTNKGITYVVWKSVFGTGNDQRFLKMSHNDWVAVFDKLYWNKHGNSSKYESVNALLVSYAWGGSKDATISGAKKILGVSSLDVVSESEAVAALMSARAQLFINISQPGNKNNVFRKGWINATNAFVAKMYVNALA